MRRSSVIGPLILIAIGALFLLKNLRPDLPVVDFLARSWPFVLIAWGGLRLFEILWWYGKRQPLPINGLSGGEWFLVVLLSVLGSGLYVAQNRAEWLTNAHFSINGLDLFDDSFQYPIPPATVKAGQAATLIIENFRGDAQITGAENTTEVHIAGKKKIRSGQQSDADGMDRQTPVELIVQGDHVIVRCNQERASDNSRVSDNLEIVVPKNFVIDARGRYGNFEVRDITGAVDIRSDNAGVRLDNLAGPVKVYTRKGDLIKARGLKGTLDISGGGSDVELEEILGQVTVTGSFSGSLQLREISKPIHIDGQQLDFRAEGIPGEVSASLSDLTGSNIIGPIHVGSKRSRDVRLTNFTQTLKLELANGNVTLEPEQKLLSPMDVQVHHGDIELTLQPQSVWKLKATSNRGEAKTDDWSDALNVTSNNRRVDIEGNSGANGPELNLHTDRGNLSISKTESSPAVAPPKTPALQAPPAVPLPSAPPVRRVE